MGLKETIGGDLVPTTASNNLDVHMEKNTEYGAMAILSASSYGNPNKIASGDTTTGNKSGVVINLNKEWVSAGNLLAMGQYVSANDRYKNKYTTSYDAKTGDAIAETAGWHGSEASTWLLRDEYSGLLRAYSGSIFSYYGYGDNRGDGPDASMPKSWYSRAAMVCGEGI